ncbi:hypothetical protein ACVWXL_002328 [Bradyrhizobium sp. GM22.5]
MHAFAAHFSIYVCFAKLDLRERALTPPPGLSVCVNLSNETRMPFAYVGEAKILTGRMSVLRGGGNGSDPVLVVEHQTATEQEHEQELR